LALEKCLSDLVVEEEEQQEEEEEKLSSMDHLCHTSTQCTFEIEEKEEENTYGFLDDILQNEFDTSKPVFIMNNLKERTEEVVDQNCRTTSSSFSFSCSSSVGSSSFMSRLSISLRDEEDFLNSIETCKRLYSTSTSSCSSSSLLLSKNTTAEATRTTPAIPAFMAQHQKELQALRYYTMQMNTMEHRK
jgi:hypothetical protein